MDWHKLFHESEHFYFEISYPNVPLNRYDGPFCLQCMKVIQGKKPYGRQNGPSYRFRGTLG